MIYEFDTTIDEINDDMYKLAKFIPEMKSQMTDEESEEFSPKFYEVLDEAMQIASNYDLSPQETRAYYKVKMYLEMANKNV